MGRIPLGKILFVKKSTADRKDFGPTGEYPVYTFRKGDKQYTDLPRLKGNGIIVSRYNEPQLKYVHGIFDVMSDCLYFMIEDDEFSVIPQYVYFCLLAHLGGLRRYYRGSSIRHLAISEFLKMEIDIPSIGEQKRIVSLLTGVDEAKGIRKRQMERFGNFLAFYFRKAAGESSAKYWLVDTIGNIANPNNGIRYIQNMKSVPNEDDVIFTRDGKAYVYPSTSINDMKDAICITMNTKECNPSYLAAVLNYDFEVRAQLLPKSRKQVNVRVLASRIEKAQIKLPSIEQQNDFALVEQQYYSICAKMRHVESRLDDLGKSLLWNIFHNEENKEHGTWTNVDYSYDIYNKVQDCDIAEYDIMMDNVFRMLSSGKLEQYFDETTNSIRLREK